MSNGADDIIMQENLLYSDEDSQEDSDEAFLEDFRVPRDCFDILWARIKRYENNDTELTRTYPLDKRMAVALYTLGSTGSYNVMSFLFGMPASTVGEILMQFCGEVCRILGPEFLPKNLITPARVHKCTQGFLNVLGFPQCLGAVDGRHFAIKTCDEEVDDYRNQKGWCSIIALALVDHRFLYMSVGCPGRFNISEAYEKSTLKKMVLRNPILQRNVRIIDQVNVPVVLIGDSSFKFCKNLMKPYSVRQMGQDNYKKLFNDILYESRKVTEIAFTKLRARFPRLDHGTDNSVEQSEIIISACGILHNFLIDHEGEIPSHWIEDATSLNPYRMQPYSSARRNSNSYSEPIRKALATDMMKKKFMDTDE